MAEANEGQNETQENDAASKANAAAPGRNGSEARTKPKNAPIDASDKHRGGGHGSQR